MNDAWLEKIYNWDESNSDLLNEIYERIGRDNVMNGCYVGQVAEDADALLAKLDVTRLSPLAMIGFLTATLYSLRFGQGRIGNVRYQLSNRPDFYHRVEQELQKRLPDRVEGLLCGLK